MKSSREQFEEWFPQMVEGMPENMVKIFDDMLFTAWQASRAAIEIELPRTQYYGDHWSGDWALDPELVVDSLNEAGVKVKP